MGVNPPEPHSSGFAASTPFTAVTLALDEPCRPLAALPDVLAPVSYKLHVHACGIMVVDPGELRDSACCSGH